MSIKACEEMPSRVSVLSSSSLARRDHVGDVRADRTGPVPLRSGLRGEPADRRIRSIWSKVGLLALEVPLDGGTEDPLDAAQVFLDLLDLLGHLQEEGQVFFLIAAEVEDADIPHLAVAGDTAIALLELATATRECRSG